MYKEGEDLSSFLNQFEYVMRESEVDRKDWGAKLLNRLTPKLNQGVWPRLEMGAEYDELRSYLMNSVGATVAAYNHRLFAVNLDSIRKLDSTNCLIQNSEITILVLSVNIKWQISSLNKS